MPVSGRRDEHIRTPESCSALTREGVLTHTTRRVSLQDVTLSEMGQTHEDKSCLTPFTGGPCSQTHRQEADGGARGWGWGGGVQWGSESVGR